MRSPEAALRTRGVVEWKGISYRENFPWGRKRESEYERDDAKRRDLVFVTRHSSFRHSEYYALGCESQKAV